MIRLSEIKLTLAEAEQPEATLHAAARRLLGLDAAEIARIEVFKRSFDARKADLLRCTSSTSRWPTRRAKPRCSPGSPDHPHIAPTPDMAWRPPVQAAVAARRCGRWSSASGPAASSRRWCWRRWACDPSCWSAARPVRERTKDTWGLWRKSVLNPESNVQFGEGGAGTFSDGKLYSQIKDPRHLGRKVMNEFVKAGAPDGDPLRRAPAHRHLQAGEGGGEHARADHRPGRRDPLRAARDRPADRETASLRGLTVLNQATGQSSELRADHVVLALGHSSRDTFEMLHERGVYMEAKPFSIGFRIEHPQGADRPRALGPPCRPPAAGRGRLQAGAPRQQRPLGLQLLHVPGRHRGGGDLASRGRVVTNGMSQYSRNERNANAGIVVGHRPARLPGRAAGRRRACSAQLESNAFVLGGGTYDAPGQLVGDFIAGRPSTQLGEVEPSYKPGVTLGDLHAALPDYAIEAMREALPGFGRKIKGFDMHDAVLTGVETRTSSPLRSRAARTTRA